MYPFKSIEPKWQKYWKENATFRVSEDEKFPKNKRAYVLDMFPYPSAQGLHVGHPEGYTATDIYCRYLRMNGCNVLHPMGFDAFGLPAENYAIKTGTHPRTTTQANINHFRKQIQSFGFCYDWDREISTCDSDYYHWTQWIFLQLYKKGLAYEDETPINWCPSCLTGLANEEVKNGTCDRCGTIVTRKNIRQWILRITAYAERLLCDLDTLDWSDSIKLMQKNWIGKSEGAEVSFKIDSHAADLRIYTTRPDTLFGATYMVIAPEHPLVSSITAENQKKAVGVYIEEAAKKSDLERTDLAKGKTGVFTGAYAVNPVNGEKLPIWISDYILISYGTGAIMAVPAHDERDWEFAKTFNLPIKRVVVSAEEWKAANGNTSSFEQEPKECTAADGITVNSAQFSGLSTDDTKKNITQWLHEQGIGEKAVNYKLRDWVFSRQRYWGEPIPLVHCEKCGIVPLNEEDLPLTLPEVETYQPTGTGESPLAGIDAWVNTICPKCGGKAKRETNTMPQWAGSCWYYLRYLDPKNTTAFVDKKAVDYWMPVSLYIGGAEHAVLHLLYARFWHKVLYDLGLVNTIEPFQRLVNQGMILGEGGIKMSKSLGNVINPDDVIAQYGADSVRMYEMFMGPLEVSKPWSTNGLVGVNRFLERIWNISEKPFCTDSDMPAQAFALIQKLLHKTIKKVSEDTKNLAFNTAISQMMIFINEATRLEKMPLSVWTAFIKLIAPYTPHLGEELWQKMGYNQSIANENYPEWDEKLCQDESATIVVQVNGKIRDKFETPRGTVIAELEKKALATEGAKKFMEGKNPVKIIAVQDKIVNIVVK